MHGLFSSIIAEQSGVLLQAGVCMRVPFNRVTIKKSAESTEPNDMLDFAGVSLDSRHDVYSGHVVCQHFHRSAMRHYNIGSFRRV